MALSPTNYAKQNAKADTLEGKGFSFLWHQKNFEDGKNKWPETGGSIPNTRLFAEHRVFEMLGYHPTDFEINLADRKASVPGVHIIFGMPRSGKTTLGKSIIEAFNGYYLIMDEPVSYETASYYFSGRLGLAQIMLRIFKSKVTHFCIDSIRTLINSLGGTTGKGGISTVYKELITHLHNSMVGQGKSLYLVVTNDADLIMDLRASCASVTIIENFKFTTQFRDEASPKSERSLFNGGNSSKIKTPNSDKLTDVSANFEGVTLDDYNLVRRSLADDPDAMNYLRAHLPYETFVRMILNYRQANVFGVSDRDVTTSVNYNQKKTDPATVKKVTETDFSSIIY